MSTSREIAGMIDSHNRKSVPPLPPSLRAAAAAYSLYVFNVGPEMWIRPVGTGTYMVKACKPGEPYSEPTVIDATVFNTVQGETGMRWEPSEGWDVARDIVQIGRMADYTRHGVFISETPIPSPEALEKARNARIDYLSSLVRDADEAYAVNGGAVTVSVGGNNVTRNNIQEVHRAAVRELGWSRPYASREIQMQSCWNCGRSVLPTSAKCFHEGCGAPLKDEAAKLRFMHTEDPEEKRGPGRPRTA